MSMGFVATPLKILGLNLLVLLGLSMTGPTDPKIKFYLMFLWCNSNEIIISVIFVWKFFGKAWNCTATETKGLIFTKIFFLTHKAYKLITTKIYLQNKYIQSMCQGWFIKHVLHKHDKKNDLNNMQDLNKRLVLVFYQENQIWRYLGILVIKTVSVNKSRIKKHKHSWFLIF